MNYSNMSLEELLKIRDGSCKLYDAIARRYYNNKKYEDSIKYLKMALEYEDRADTLGLLIHIYYSIYNKSITTVYEPNARKYMLEYMSTYNKLYLVTILSNSFELFKGVQLPDIDYTKNKDDAIFLRYLFLGAIERPSELNENLKALEILVDSGYANAAFYLGWRYEEGKYIDRDVNMAIKYYTIAHNNKMSHAAGRLSVLYEELGEHDKAFKFAFDSATNYRGSKYNYTMSDMLLNEMKKDKGCCYGGLLFLADLYEGLDTYIQYKVTPNIAYANQLYRLSNEFGDDVHEKYFARFALVHPECVSDSELKSLIKNHYLDLPYAYACEKAVKFGLKKEASSIFKLVLQEDSYLPVYDLLEAFPDRKDEIDPVLQKLKKEKLNYPLWYPRIQKHRDEIKAKEEKKKEEQRLKEKKIAEEKKAKVEAEREKRKIEAEKKEKELEIKREESKKKTEDEYSNIVGLIKEEKIKETVSLMERNKGYLAKKFPVVYFMVKCANKEECPKFEVNAYNTMYKKDSTTDDDRQYVNRLIMGSAKIHSWLDSDIKELTPKQIKEASSMRDSNRSFTCVNDIRRDIMYYVNKNFTDEEKVKYCLGLALLSSLLFDFNICAHWCDKSKRFLMYQIGSSFTSWNCIYNKWALEYKKLGLFKKKEKQKIIDDMKRIASFNTPAYLWLKKHKIAVEEQSISKLELETLKSMKDYYVDLDIK